MGSTKKENPEIYSLRISKHASRNIDQITGVTLLISNMSQPMRFMSVKRSSKQLKGPKRIRLHSGSVQKYQRKTKYIVKPSFLAG